jgi:signal transduction histidine kinase
VWDRIPYSLLDALAPFHAIFAVDHPHRQVSSRLRRIAGVEYPEVLLVRPFAAPVNGKLLDELTGMVLFFELDAMPGRQFKGQAIRFEDRIMLVGVPLLRSIADLERFGMVTADLPLHDATGDLLLAFEATQISLRQAAESQEVSRLSRRSQEWLLQAKQQADETARLQADFINNVSHEMKTPLNAIIGFSHLLAQPCEDAEHKRYVEGISVAGSRLMSIINDVLDFSVNGHDATPLQVVTFSLQDLCHEIGQLWGPKVLAKGLGWHLENTVAPVLLMGDPWRVAQLLGYLLSNALKFTERGTIGLLVTAREHDNGDRLLRFSVSDTGPGMEQDQVGRLLMPFRQADGSSSRKQGGTGLGLAVCKRIVTRMNGRIELQSTSGRGTNASIELPFAVVPRNERPECAELRLAEVESVMTATSLPGFAGDVAPASGTTDAGGTVSTGRVADMGTLRLMLSDGDAEAPGYLHRHADLLSQLPAGSRLSFADAVARYDFDEALRILDTL